MKIVIVGDGKVGYTLTRQLCQEGHEIVVIDSNQRVLEQSVAALDVGVVHGNGATLAIQKEAQVDQADLLIAATSGDELNLLCCILAKNLGCKYTIARVRNPDYSQQLTMLREDLGISMIINPERAAAREIFRLLQFPSFLKRDTFCHGRAELVELKVKPGSLLANTYLRDLPRVLNANVLLCAVNRGGELIIPSGDFQLLEDDIITVTADRDNLVRMTRILGLTSEKVREVMLIGGGHIAGHLIKMLLSSGVRVKVIEQKMDRCQDLSLAYPNANVICGDGTSQELLTAEGIQEMDAIIPLTDMDEENIIISLYAGHMGVPKTITKLSRAEYEPVFRGHGLGSVISPKLLAANDIVGYVRAMKQTTTSEMISLYRLCDEQAEAVEFLAKEGTQHLGIPFKQLRLRSNLLVACIKRGNVVIIPKGDDHIQAGDYVVVVTTTQHNITALNDIFQSAFLPEVTE